MALENKERYKKKMIIFKRENSNFESRPSRRPRNKVQKKIIVKEVIPNHIINQMKEFLKAVWRSVMSMKFFRVATTLAKSVQIK